MGKQHLWLETHTINRSRIYKVKIHPENAILFKFSSSTHFLKKTAIQTVWDRLLWDFPSPVLGQAVPIVSGDGIPPTGDSLGSELSDDGGHHWPRCHAEPLVPAALLQKANNRSRATLLQGTAYCCRELAKNSHYLCRTTQMLYTPPSRSKTSRKSTCVSKDSAELMLFHTSNPYRRQLAPFQKIRGEKNESAVDSRICFMNHWLIYYKVDIKDSYKEVPLRCFC